ncbi:MAG TPA: hypothetical protein PKX07_07515 [Aggregatilineales bacterium]|nr:hypothetical protein [Aggregatilineales bacterium]
MRGALLALLVAAPLGHTAVISKAALFVEIRPHPAIVVIHQTHRFPYDAARAVDAIMQQIRTDRGRLDPVRGHARAHRLTGGVQIVINDGAVLALKPLFAAAARLTPLPQCAFVDRIAVRHASGIDIVLQQIADHLAVDRLASGASLLHHGLLIHVLGDVGIAVIAGRV